MNLVVIASIFILCVLLAVYAVHDELVPRKKEQDTDSCVESDDDRNTITKNDGD